MKFSFKNGMSRLLFGKLSKKTGVLFLFFGAVLLLSGCNFTMGDDMISSPNSPSPFDALKCPACAVFSIAFDAGRALCSVLYKASLSFAQSLLAIGLAIWLALHVMKFVSSVKEPDVAGFWNAIATRFFCAALAALAFLPNLDSWTEAIFDTLLQLSVRFSATVISTLPAPSILSPLDCGLETTLKSLNCLISGSSVRLMMGPLMMFTNPTFWVGMLLNPLTLVTSILVIIVFLIMVIGLPLFLLETILEYFVTLSLLPLWIVAWVFPITRNFTKQAWEKLVPILFQIFGFCVFLALASQVYGQIVKSFFRVEDLLNPLTVLTAPGLLLFISLFMYFFGKVLLQVINTVFSISGADGKIVNQVSDKLGSLAAKAGDKFQDKALGETAQNDDGKIVQQKDKKTGERDEGSLANRANNTVNELKERLKAEQQAKQNGGDSANPTPGGGEK